MGKSDEAALVQRLERLEVAANAPRDAAQTYHRNFGFKIRAAGANDAIIEVGDAEIRLSPADTGREGMTALRLAADDLDRLIDTLRRAGIEPEEIIEEFGCPAIRIPLRATGNVPLIVIERKR